MFFRFFFFVFIPTMLPSVVICKALNKSGREQKEKEKETKIEFQIRWQIIIWWAINWILLYSVSSNKQTTTSYEPFSNDPPIWDRLLSFCDKVRVAHTFIIICILFVWNSDESISKNSKNWFGSAATRHHDIIWRIFLINLSILCYCQMEKMDAPTATINMAKLVEKNMHSLDVHLFRDWH